MNFLAHLHASPNHPMVRVFNFSGDGYKGNRWKDHASNAELIGVGLHRHIDSFTDAHPLSKDALATLRPELGKVAGIALDLFGDYFLHKHWAKFQHLQPFTTHVSNVAFTQQCVAEISEHHEVLKGKTRVMAPHLVTENWILNYRDLTGLERAANGISRRHPVARALHGYFGNLPEGHYAAAEEWMLAFYPELIRSSQKWVADREGIGAGL